MNIFAPHTHIKHLFITAIFAVLFFFALFFLFVHAIKAEACPADNPNCNSLECTSYPCTPPGNPPPASLAGCTTQTIIGIGTFSTCSDPIMFGGYLEKMYGFLLSFVAVAAFGGITYGGLLYVLSAGSVSSTEEAKKWIWNALIGLLITAISFIILYTINPDLISNFNLDLSKYQTTAPQQQTNSTQQQTAGPGESCSATVLCRGEGGCIYDTLGNGVCPLTNTK